jgi:hypothetical protein
VRTWDSSAQSGFFCPDEANLGTICGPQIERVIQPRLATNRVLLHHYNQLSALRVQVPGA